VSSSPARTKDPVTVTIGGQTARVVDTAYPADAAPFTDLSGFAPGLVGVYQINVEMPSGVTPGDSMPVTLTIAGQTSPMANLAAR
jgi:uncharacterized protein (TIGR03437 family)